MAMDRWSISGGTIGGGTIGGSTSPISSSWHEVDLEMEGEEHLVEEEDTHILKCRCVGVGVGVVVRFSVMVHDFKVLQNFLLWITFVHVNYAFQFLVLVVELALVAMYTHHCSDMSYMYIWVS